MKTEKELNEDILKITMIIEETFPELSKYISEIPLKNNSNQGSDAIIKSLTDYYNSLDIVFREYGSNHGHPRK